MRFNSLNVSLIRRDELISQLITSRHFRLFCPKIFMFRLVVMSSVTSWKCNSSHCNVLIVSVLDPDVTSDEFLTKTFSRFSSCRHCPASTHAFKPSKSVWNHHENKKNTLFLKKVAKKFGDYIKTPYLCTRFWDTKLADPTKERW